MIEIVFGESACGSLKIAQTYGKGKYRGSAVSIFMRHEDGSVPSSDEMKKAQLQAQEQERIAWENAIPLGGKSSDVYEKLLFNTKVKTAVLKNDVLTVTFAASLEPTFFASEITYMSSEGKNKTVLLKAPATQVKIDDFAGDHITYRSVYLPEETAIDYFYSESDELEIN